MRQGSIAARLFWLSAAWLVLALAATALLLSELYSRALDTSLNETLEFHLETLVGRALEPEGLADTRGALADPRFDRPLSGWYWQITTPEGNVTAFSPSLVGSILPKLSGPFNAANIRTGRLTDSGGVALRVLERRITFDGTTQLFTVSGNLDEIAELVGEFRGQTLVVLGAVGIMLAVMSTIVGRFALRPVERLRNAVEAVRQGETEKVEGSFPAELAPLADEVNELLRSNAQIVERARSQVGNLAHGLKTPLAVLRNEADGEQDGLGAVVLAEANKMASLVSSYLDRARLSARTTVIGRKAEAAPVLTRLVRVMGKLHRDRTVALQLPDGDGPWFRGEESDLEEMVGNLLDNACKWAANEVVVTLSPDGKPGAAQFCIAIEDDGPGLSSEDTSKVLQRGVRLDEKVPGSGLGLDIVKELTDVYGGELKLSRGQKGGLRVELWLPAARSGRR